MDIDLTKLEIDVIAVFVCSFLPYSGSKYQILFSLSRKSEFKLI